MKQSADGFSSELWPKVPCAATLVSGPTAAWGIAGFMDEETATPRRGQATDDDETVTAFRSCDTVNA